MPNTCTYYGYAGKGNYVPRRTLTGERLGFCKTLIQGALTVALEIQSDVSKAGLL